MRLQQSVPTGTQLEVTHLAGGRLQVKGAVSIAIYEPGEFSYDPDRDELHLPQSRGQKLIRQPFRHGR